jgi:Mg/Co/Ni transporter MgtE
MQSTVYISLTPKELIKAINDMKKKERDAFLEDLLASTSPEYISSIREARAEYKTRKVKTHKEVFGS